MKGEGISNIISNWEKSGYDKPIIKDDKQLNYFQIIFPLTHKTERRTIDKYSKQVEEWCKDWYDPNYYSISPVNNPQGPVSGTEKVLRGGAWTDALGGSSYLRCAKRFTLDPATAHWNNPGIRVVSTE